MYNVESVAMTNSDQIQFIYNRYDLFKNVDGDATYPFANVLFLHYVDKEEECYIECCIRDDYAQLG